MFYSLLYLPSSKNLEFSSLRTPWTGDSTVQERRMTKNEEVLQTSLSKHPTFIFIMADKVRAWINKA